MATLIAPNPYAVFQTRGATYTADGSGNITVSVQADAQDLIASGCIYASQATGGGSATITPTTVSAAGTNQATATQLTGLMSIVGTVAAGTGVRVADTLNDLQTIVNDGANVLTIYPLSGMTFSGLAQNAGYKIAVGISVGIIATSVTQAYIVFGSPSAFG